MIDFARGAKGGFLGVSGLTTLRPGVPAAKPSRASSRLPSATAPRLRPDWRKNCLRVRARAFQSLVSRFMGSTSTKIADVVRSWQLLSNRGRTRIDAGAGPKIRPVRHLGTRASVLDCGSPLPLLLRGSFGHEIFWSVRS